MSIAFSLLVGFGIKGCRIQANSQLKDNGYLLYLRAPDSLDFTLESGSTFRKTGNSPKSSLTQSPLTRLTTLSRMGLSNTN